MAGIITDTAALARGREIELLGALGITPPRHGHLRCPTLAHEDRSPSWRWDDRTGRWHCTCGHGDVLDLIQAMGLAHDAVAAAAWAREVLGLPSLATRQETAAERRAREAQAAQARRQAEERQRERDREDAERNADTVEWIRNELWGWSYSARGTAAETYLRGRGITVLPDILGYLPAYGRERLPAMIAPFGIASESEPGRYEIEPNAISGMHITLLTEDGQKARDREGRSKITLGRGHDAPLMLVPPNDGLALCIAEGIEDALSVHQATGLGAWAAGTAGRLPGLACHVPPYVEAVIVIIDGDDAGRRHGYALADALYRRGVETLTREIGGRADAA